MARVISLALALLLALTLSARAEMVLLMAEEVGCMWCARWNNEVGHIYPKTNEGRIAPLQRFDLHEGLPKGITVTRPVRFTPTFLLVEDGTEKGRIEGYPGEDLFWSMLSVLFERAKIDIPTSG